MVLIGGKTMSIAGREGREHDKRIRAEVLAACREAVQELRRDWEKRSPSDDDNGFSECLMLIQKRFRKLQPASSDLEALLRKAELHGRLLELRDWPQLCNRDIDNPRRHALCCKYHQEIHELEKACDEGK